MGNRKLMVEDNVDFPAALMARRDELASTGRTAVLSIVPAVSVAVLGWIVVGALMLGVALLSAALVWVLALR